MQDQHPSVAQLRHAQGRFDEQAKPGQLQTSRYSLRYFDWGTGDPILVIHGMCDTSRSFCMMMSELVDRGFRCISYELANGKDDDAILGQYSHADFAADAIALLDHLQLPSVHIFGSSFGSTITLRSLATYPERFRKAIIQGGFACRPLNWIEYRLACLGRYWPWRMNQLPIRDEVMRRLEIQQFVGCPPEIFEFLIECSGLTPVRAAARRGLILHQLDLRPMLKTIKAPLLMIGGDRDALVPRSKEQEVEDGVPNVRRVEFQPCGHYPQYTMPVPTAIEIEQFLRS